jgi:hypothetical protein
MTVSMTADLDRYRPSAASPNIGDRVALHEDAVRLLDQGAVARNAPWSS